MALTTELRVKFAAQQSGTDNFGAPAYYPTIEKILQFASGTGADQADLLFVDEDRSISASATEDLDLAGVLADAFGTTITMAEVVAILVIASASNTNNVVIGDATSPVPLFGGTNPTFAVKPGGFFFVAAPNASGLFTVGAGSTDDLKVANSSSGSSVTYSIAILGRSA